MGLGSSGEPSERKPEALLKTGVLLALSRWLLCGEARLPWASPVPLSHLKWVALVPIPSTGTDTSSVGTRCLTRCLEAAHTGTCELAVTHTHLFAGPVCLPRREGGVRAPSCPHVPRDCRAGLPAQQVCGGPSPSPLPPQLSAAPQVPLPSPGRPMCPAVNSVTPCLRRLSPFR